jgi:hypothetical protein
MVLRFKSWSALALSCVAVTAGTAHAALEVALHEVNTSVGLKPTNATNQWKLQTDPEIENGSSATVLVPLAGALDTTYDPSEFALDVDPTSNPLIIPTTPITPNYQLGYSVQGIDPFKVTSFDVYDTNGGFYHVAASSNPLFDTVTPEPNSQNQLPNGIEAGLIAHINFVLDPSLKNEVLPATVDQLFYEANLTALHPPPNMNNPKDGTSGSPGDFLTVGDPNDNTNTTTITFGDPGVIFVPSALPEPTAVGLLCIGAAGLMGRRRKA